LFLAPFDSSEESNMGIVNGGNGKLLVDELFDIKSIIVYLFKSVKLLGEGILRETERLKVVVFLIAISMTLSML
jgi:hypothetical protein